MLIICKSFTRFSYHPHNFYLWLTIFIQMPLNNTQLEILKLFEHEQSEEDLKEIKSLLVTYLADKVSREADKAFDEKGYTTSIFEKWKRDHFRKSA